VILTVPVAGHDLRMGMETMMARIVNSRCVLAVRDLEVSTRYYKEVLGFSQEPIEADGWSFLTRDTFRVMLGECANERPASELGDHSYFAYWNVDDVDGFGSENLRPWGAGHLSADEQTVGTPRVWLAHT
jgi:catechol 2,3-dioxygenase-like lactoylglutathione lyase family enzyme